MIKRSGFKAGHFCDLIIKYSLENPEEYAPHYTILYRILEGSTPREKALPAIAQAFAMDQGHLRELWERQKPHTEHDRKKAAQKRPVAPKKRRRAPKEVELVEKFQKLGPRAKSMVLDYLDFMIDRAGGGR